MERLRIMHLVIDVFLLIVIVLFILTGFGITNYQIVQPLTFGTLSKLTAYQIHINLIIPFLILLGAHFTFIIIRKFQKKS